MSVEATIETIRKMHASHMKMQEMKARSKELTEEVKRTTKKRKKEFDPDDQTNINQYTDASKYAKEYYGEVMFETTRYDNDWD